MKDLRENLIFTVLLFVVLVAAFSLALYLTGNGGDQTTLGLRGGGNLTSITNTFVEVGVATTTVLSVDTGRRYLFMQNPGANDVNCAFGDLLVASSVPMLLKVGASVYESPPGAAILEKVECISIATTTIGVIVGK